MQYLYLLKAGDKHYKVGIAVNVRGRVTALQAHNPEHIDIVTTKLVDNAYDIEQATHKALADMKADGANEWFRLSPEQALDLCVVIHVHPDPDISERLTLKAVVDDQRRIQRIIERKLDYVINTYQKLKPVEQVTVVGPEPKLPAPIIEQPAQQAPTPADRNEDDVRAALNVIRRERKASTSLLQRRLSIGYGRAARIMDQLEADGYIGPPDGARPRELLNREDVIANKSGVKL